MKHYFFSLSIGLLCTIAVASDLENVDTPSRSSATLPSGNLRTNPELSLPKLIGRESIVQEYEGIKIIEKPSDTYALQFVFPNSMDNSKNDNDLRISFEDFVSILKSNIVTFCGNDRGLSYQNISCFLLHYYDIMMSLQQLYNVTHAQGVDDKVDQDNPCMQAFKKFLAYRLKLPHLLTQSHLTRNPNWFEKSLLKDTRDAKEFLTHNSSVDYNRYAVLFYNAYGKKCLPSFKFFRKVGMFVHESEKDNAETTNTDHTDLDHAVASLNSETSLSDNETSVSDSESNASKNDTDISDDESTTSETNSITSMPEKRVSRNAQHSSRPQRSSGLPYPMPGAMPSLRSSDSATRRIHQYPGFSQFPVSSWHNNTPRRQAQSHSACNANKTLNEHPVNQHQVDRSRTIMMRPKHSIAVPQLGQKRARTDDEVTHDAPVTKKFEDMATKATLQQSLPKHSVAAEETPKPSHAVPQPISSTSLELKQETERPTCGTLRAVLNELRSPQASRGGSQNQSNNYFKNIERSILGAEQYIDKESVKIFMSQDNCEDALNTLVQTTVGKTGEYFLNCVSLIGMK